MQIRYAGQAAEREKRASGRRPLLSMQAALLTAADLGVAFACDPERRLPSWGADWSRGYACGGRERRIGPPIRPRHNPAGRAWYQFGTGCIVRSVQIVPPRGRWGRGGRRRTPRAPGSLGWGPSGRWFKSSRPDYSEVRMGNGLPLCSGPFGERLTNSSWYQPWYHLAGQRPSRRQSASSTAHGRQARGQAASGRGDPFLPG